MNQNFALTSVKKNHFVRLAFLSHKHSTVIAFFKK